MTTTSPEFSEAFSLELGSFTSMDLKELTLLKDRDSSEEPLALSIPAASPEESHDIVLYCLASIHVRLNVEFQWFFIALSVLPCKSLAIDAHLLPWIA